MTSFIQEDPTLKSKKALASIMMSQGAGGGPVKHWTQGLAKVLSGGMGAYMDKKAGDDEKERTSGIQEQLAQVMAGDGDFNSKMAGMSAIPGINKDFVTNMQLQQQMQPKARDPIADYKAKKEIDQLYPGQDSEFDQYLKSLQAEKAKNEIEAQEIEAAAASEKVKKDEDATKHAVNLIDKAISHPGREAATGFSSILNPFSMPGSDRTNFLSLADQLKGKNFLAAFESLKGGGTITEVEGLKAEQAQNRLNEAQSEEEYLLALEEMKGILTGEYKVNTGEVDRTPPSSGFSIKRLP